MPLIPPGAPLADAEAIAATQALPELVINVGAIAGLHQYDWTLPLKGATSSWKAGYRWRRWVGRDHCSSGWVVGEYGPADEEGNPIRWYRAVVSLMFSHQVELPGFGYQILSKFGANRTIYEVWCDRLPRESSIVADHWGWLILSLMRLPIRP